MRALSQSSLGEAANGRLSLFARLAIAVVQLHQTGHSSIVQHFRRVKVGSAGFAVLISHSPCLLSLHCSFPEAGVDP
mgnify:CR=1 FL=1